MVPRTVLRAVILATWLLSSSVCFQVPTVCSKTRHNESKLWARIRPKRPSLVQQRKEEADKESEERRQQALKDPTLLTNVHFAERSDLHPNSKRALLHTMGLQTMTQVQSQTYQAAFHGKDVLARARTGTGKTVAFLLPSIERILLEHSVNNNPNQIPMLILSPTRELALQIAEQATQLLTYHSDFTVQVIYGGTKIIRDTNAFNRRLPTILVATPGRLLDHLKTTNLSGGRNFGRDIMSKTSILVLDETDRLLDMGFRRDIQAILSYLPRKNKRQTLLFSATIPKQLSYIINQLMDDDYVTVDCVDKSNASHKQNQSLQPSLSNRQEETNARVTQTHLILPHKSMIHYVPSVLQILLHALSSNQSSNNNKDNKKEPIKIVAFFPTAKMVSYFASFFTNNNNNNIQTLLTTPATLNNIPIFEIHSKKSQGYRTRASESFRKATNGILFTSDVSARGIDYPGVTHVIQFGLPESKEQYIHRLGRTARAGNKGYGWLVLSEFESFFVKKDLRGLDIPVNEELQSLLLEKLNYDDNDDEEQDIIQQMIKSSANSNDENAQSVYRSFLGYYTSQIRCLPQPRTTATTKEEQLVLLANELAISMGLDDNNKKDALFPPPLTKRMVTKMGLKGVKGLRVVESLLPSSSLLSTSISSSGENEEENNEDSDNDAHDKENDTSIRDNSKSIQVKTRDRPRRRQRQQQRETT